MELKNNINDQEDFKRINQLDVFEIKKDLVQTLVELGLDKDEIVVDDKNTVFLSSWYFRFNFIQR